LRRAGQIGLAVVAALLLFAAGIVVRVLLGPVSLGPFTGQLRTSMAEVLPGLSVRFDDAALEWSRAEGRIDLVILGARVFDANQRIIAQAPKAEIGLAAGPFLRGKIMVRRITLVGVQLTLVHTRDGRLRLGLEKDKTQGDVLERIRDALSKRQGETSLKTFAVHNARLAFYEEVTGLFLVAPEANLEISTGQNDNPRPNEVLVASIDAHMEISGHPTHVVANVNVPRNAEHITGDLSVTGLSLGALAANTKFFSFLEPFALTTDISGSFALDHGLHLTLPDFGIGATGVVNGLGKPLHVKELRVVGRYDGATGRLLIDDATLAGDQAHAHLGGTGNLAFDEHGALTRASLDLAMDKIGIDLPGVMGQAVTLTRAAFRGSYVTATRSIAIDQALLFGGPLSANFSGAVTLANGQSPGIDIAGKVNAISIRDLLHYWPLQLAGGVRNWIDNNMAAGRIGPIAVRTHILPGALDQPALPEDAVAITFPISGGTVSYIHGMTPLTRVTGDATLSGDTFKGNIVSAADGPLVLSKGNIAIPNLHVAAAPATITAHVEGGFPDVLALIDEKPLQYPSRFHLKTQTARGMAAIDLAFHVPTKHNVGFDEIGLAVKGNITGLSLALGEHTKIANGALNIAVDNAALHATGTIALGAANLGVDWVESFKTPGPVTTHLVLKGLLDDNARAALNMQSGSFITGPVGVVAQLEGHRGTVQHAEVTLDLTPSMVTFDLVDFKKPPGVAATAQIDATLDGSGAVRTENFTVSGAALSAKGTVGFDTSGNLVHLEIPFARAGTANDFSVNMTRTAAAGLDVSLTGKSVDGAGLGRRDPNANDSAANGKTDATNDPFHIQVRVDKFVMRDGVTLSPFALDVSGQGDRPRTLSLSGSLSKSAQVVGAISSNDTDRRLTVQTDDASLLLRGLFGLTATKGGKLNLAATMPPMVAAVKKDPNAVEYAGKLTIEDFTIENQPFLTRVFSSGSFGGFLDLMRGQGIVIDKLDMPFSIHGDVVDIRDARASGPSLGITADGYVDRRNNQIALQGALAPLFGINGVLGAIPVLGNVFVSKKGEGLIGVTYRASGNADEPQVSMNPFSVLAPGILRRIFQGATPSAAPVQANSSATTGSEKAQ
jgi:AsmA-like C-terminal region/Protein of unknown function